jgi:hypothetical protein
MHTAKVTLELLLTLAVMRLLSWGLGWVLSRVLRKGPFRVSLIANAAALAIFAGFIAWDLAPGEPFDYEAVTFGAVVYLLCLVSDLKWRPWQRQPAQRPMPFD